MDRVRLPEGPQECLEVIHLVGKISRKGGLKQWKLDEFFSYEEKTVLEQFVGKGITNAPSVLPSTLVAKLDNANRIIDFYNEARTINGDKETQDTNKTYDISEIDRYARLSFGEIDATGKTETWMVGYGSLMGTDSGRDIGETDKLPVEIPDYVRDISCMVSSVRNYPWVENGLRPPEGEVGAAGIRRLPGATVSAVAMKLTPAQTQKIKEREWPAYATLPVTTRTMEGKLIPAVACIPAPTSYVIRHMSETERRKFGTILSAEGKSLASVSPNPQYLGTLLGDSFVSDPNELLENSVVGDISVREYLQSRTLPTNPKTGRFYERKDARGTYERQEIDGKPRWELAP